MTNSFKNNFIDRQFKHVRLFQDNMILLEKNRDKLPFSIKEWELIRACLDHDHDKFFPELLNGQMAFQELLYNKRNDLSTSKIDQNLIEKARKKHYESNPHHAEYHILNNIPISNINICEMCCDMAAVCQELNIECYSQYFRESLISQFEILKEKQSLFLTIFDLLEDLTKKP